MAKPFYKPPTTSENGTEAVDAYWCGETAVQTVARGRRAEFWHYLYANMHTPETLRTFWTN